MTWDYSKLKGKIREKCGTQESFAKLIGIGRVSLSKRLNNQMEFSQEEMFRACKVLDIEETEIPSVFFKEKV